SGRRRGRGQRRRQPQDQDTERYRHPASIPLFERKINGRRVTNGQRRRMLAARNRPPRGP
ncbi:MAG TPA: hypothetical protein PLO65_00985, partial [Caulobacter sp.]|nr:hypothetical protein [Caulobacter sp.]